VSAPTASVSFMSSQTSANTAAHETHKQLPRPPLECIALLLEGGGALRAYQAGVYEALSQAHLAPDWVARRTDVNDPGPPQATVRFLSFAFEELRNEAADVRDFSEAIEHFFRNLLMICSGQIGKAVSRGQ